MPLHTLILINTEIVPQPYSFLFPYATYNTDEKKNSTLCHIVYFWADNILARSL